MPSHKRLQMITCVIFALRLMDFIRYFDWSRLSDSADRRCAQAGKDSLFFSHAWFQSLSFSAFEDEQQVVLACERTRVQTR